MPGPSVTATRTEPFISVDSDARRKILKLRRSICSTSNSKARPSSLSDKPDWSRKKSLNPSSSSSRSILRISVVPVSPELPRHSGNSDAVCIEENARKSSHDALSSSIFLCCFGAAPRCKSCCIPVVPSGMMIVTRLGP